MMGHESMKMIFEKYYSHIKNYQRDDGGSFMENVYNQKNPYSRLLVFEYR